MTTHTGELTGRRLVITFVPTTGWKLEDSRRAGALTHVPSESSHHKVYRRDDRRIAGVEAVGLQCLAFVVVHNTLDVLPPRTVPAGSILGAGLVIARLSDL